MENSSEYVEAKTPRRTRRSSATEVGSVSKQMRSTKKIKISEIEETDSVPSDPKTPRKSIKLLEFRTPSKTEVMASTYTPRRSARKSIKPVQEYENIVAQKGLKRTAGSTLDDEDPTVEGKWAPAVIGRASTKRGKKSGRGKGKNLKRQRRFTEDNDENGEAKECDVETTKVEDSQKQEENTIVEEQLPNRNEAVTEKNDVDSEPIVHNGNESLNEKRNDLQNDRVTQNQEEYLDKGTDDKVAQFSLKVEESVAEKETNVEEHVHKHSGEYAVNQDESVEEKFDNVDGAKNEEGLVVETKLTQDLEGLPNQDESVSVQINEIDSNRSAEEINSEYECKNSNKQLTLDIEERKIELMENPVDGTTEKSSQQIDKPQEEAVVVTDSSDTSMEGGDLELAAMPITADDCMENLKKNPQPLLVDESLNSKSLSASGDENADDSDCIMLSLNESSSTVNSETVSREPTKECEKLLNESINSTDMPTLMICSDDEEGETGATEKPKVEILDKLEKTEKSTSPNSTFDADKSPAKNTVMIAQHTPVLRPSMSHVPTPFKSKTPIIPDIIIEPEEDLQLEEPPSVVEEPRETRLKSARKRSFSVCGDRPKRNVTFYSPANTTVSIYDGDLMNSCKKGDSSSEKRHRKRSLSVTETENEKIAYIKQKRAPDTPGSNKKQHQPTSRTKMPNFSAIHQQQFKKMESISDHVARKAERAKILSNSALKAKPASIQKGLPVKNSVLRDCNKDSKTNVSMPKARQRIELSAIEHKPKPEQAGLLNVGMQIRSKSRNDLSTLDDLPSIDKLQKFNTDSLVFAASSKPKLPKPKMDATVSSAGKAFPLPSKTAASNIPKTAETAFTQTNIPDSRPKFNLSTAPEGHSFRSNETLNDRRKRLMDMYKSRNHPRTGEKNREILKGVRTNRRFELQMMCRNRPN